MILSIDTFSDILGIALIDSSNEPVFLLNYKKPKPFSEILIKKIDENLKEYSINKKEIKAICVNKGPGAYTGLRIGITTAKVLSYALNVPLYSYESLYAMAYKYRYLNGTILSLIYAGKGEIYLRKFLSKETDIKPVTKNLIIKKEKLKEYLNGIDFIVEKNVGLENSIKISESLSFDGAMLSIKENSIENPFLLEPVYLRNT
jgi:tRNA threonylcarbamoyladenosine biosynthesis protein TsaB